MAPVGLSRRPLRMFLARLVSTLVPGTRETNEMKMDYR
jgi:hypothetical protein